MGFCWHAELEKWKKKQNQKVDGQHYDEKWPWLPSEANWILHLFLPALPFQALAPKEASKTDGPRGDRLQALQPNQGHSSPRCGGERPLSDGRSWCSLRDRGKSKFQHGLQRKGMMWGSRAELSSPSYPEPERPGEERGRELLIEMWLRSGWGIEAKIERSWTPKSMVFQPVHACALK